MSASGVLGSMPKTAWLCPLLALVFYPVASAFGPHEGAVITGSEMLVAGLLIPILFAAVFASVYHAEVIAHRTGEPFGTLVLTAAVTIIEVALITSVMLSGSDSSPALARDTVHAVVMTVCTGLVGLCVLVGGLRYREQDFQVAGASVYLTVLFVLATLTLVLPNFTQEVPGPTYSPVQLAFVSIMTLVLYGAFLYIQTMRHRDYFVALPDGADNHHGASAIPNSRVVISLVLLVVALVAVVLLSKKFAIVVEAGRLALGAPPPVTGLIVAIVILLPEGIAAVQAARNNELQKSLNLALGSSLATIGMTFPAVAVVALYLNTPLLLGLDASDMVLLALTLLVSTLTFGTGRTNILYGFVHLVIFATFLFLTFEP